MANFYEQILIDIPNFQKRSAESTVIYKQWYQPYGQDSSNSAKKIFADLYSNQRYGAEFYTSTPKGWCVYTPAQGTENPMKVAENGWEISDLSYDDETNILKVDIARPMKVTDPDEKYLSHNFTAGQEYQVMMNWMSLPYQCIRGSNGVPAPRPCPGRPQGNAGGSDGTYVLYRVFGEENKEQSAANPVGATMKVLENAKYVKVITSLALAAVSTYLF